MENSLIDLDPRKIKIKRLIKLRGQNLKVLATREKINYFLLSKYLSQKGYRTYGGREHPYKVPHIKKAISEYLDIKCNDLWGLEGEKILDGLIEEAITRKIQKEIGGKRFAQGAGRRKWNFKKFLTNLYSLGKYSLWFPGRYKRETQER